jgi:2-polyprenyl-3-methyl-5-hydroxy-6-metoxy-1,4-benzoquinol methylase/uncharacterized protein YbaR (Trm112 family)
MSRRSGLPERAFAGGGRQAAGRLGNLPLDLLACPRDRRPLSLRADQTLVCERGHVYPVVDGVPVLLLPDVEQTLSVARASLARAQGMPGAVDERDPRLHLESLGISEAEKEQAVALAAGGGRSIDPVVSVIIGATGGIAYKNLIGADFDYPIPEIRLPPANGERLLDIGCNWGRWSLAAARTGYRVVGIDPSLGAVMAARRVAQQFGLPIDYVCGDGRYLPFASGAFDVVFSYSVIQHFSRPDAVRTFDGIGRVLRPGGRALVQMPNRFGVRSLAHLLRRRFADGSGFDVRYWTVAALKQAMGCAVGPAAVTVHCYFGLGLEPSDRPLMSRGVGLLLDVSEFLRRSSERLPFLIQVADSVYVSAAKPNR